ncbi:hypothetical protein [Maledivibacter halophilus]|uniref:Uncharacterized protein n=1 Tax=Maledivibacter halophilus TaxID=36842 RepID=A0A1T5MNY0_9FIRM|nr:hypothetical protein [Maledivibacter halophilus]SKC89724.1 hypothetical protein SAMN02194393_05064 [Maledivibacter halophilus]
MELNKKILKFGLVLITLSLIFTAGFSLIYSLEKPVFLKMYVEEYTSGDENLSVLENFEVRYITNISDSRKVMEIEFEEEPDIEVTVSHWPKGGGMFSFFNNNNYNNQSRDIYGRYALNTIYIDMNLNNIDREFNETELNNAKVKFNDGSTLDINLGRIIIYKNERKNDYIDSISSGSSSDGTSSFEGRVTKAIKLLEVKSPLLEDLKDYFDLSIGDTDYRKVSGVKYEKDKSLAINAKFIAPKDIVSKYTFYDIKPKLYYEDIEGNISYTRIYNINYTPYDFDLKGIFNYLRARGEI